MRGLVHMQCIVSVYKQITSDMLYINSIIFNPTQLHINSFILQNYLTVVYT